MIRQYGGEAALQQWHALEDRMKPLQQGAALFPAAALRNDAGEGGCAQCCRSWHDHAQVLL